MCSETEQHHRRAVRRALARMRAAPECDASLGQTARDVQMSPFHFHRAFRRWTGRAVAEHRRALRMARARRLLLGTEMSIAEVAGRCGYANADSFARAFRRAHGANPSEYRVHDTERVMEHPFAGASVGFVKIPVRDFERARVFYRDTLGLEEQFAVPAYSWAQYACGGVPLCLYVPGEGGGGASPGGETGIQLRVTDAKAAFAHVTEHAHGELQEGDDGSVSFVLRDPDGNLLQVLQV